METDFRTLDLLQIDGKESSLKICCIAGKLGLDRKITNRKINRPGLALGGYFDFFSYQSIQVFGKGESNFIKNNTKTKLFDNVKKMLEFEIPCCIFANDNTPPDSFCDLADKNNVPVIISKLSTDDLMANLFELLGDVFSPKTTIHGSLVEVFGIGILILGKSGIGKSETALELVERGHRLIADDTIELKLVKNKVLMGKSTKIIAHHMEIKGIGIINVKNLFGIGAVREEKKVQLVIELDDWDPNKEYDRIGIDDKFIEYLGLPIPYLLIPVMPGRNIPIVMETAARNQRLKMQGINAAKEFNKNLLEYYETEEIKNSYFYNKE
ncbi:MAG: HPr(Ser) kinase/phosphatase [Spirochaetes bacterium]|nr:HPr(Ser) kinase/phosphatase [Spirochaetota bacterium]